MPKSKRALAVAWITKYLATPSTVRGDILYPNNTTNNAVISSIKAHIINQFPEQKTATIEENKQIL